jgi:hypothetical protein
MRRKYFFIILILLLLIPAYFLVVEAQPKTSGQFPFMVILMGIDVYLWLSLRKQMSALKTRARVFIGILYWMLAAFVFLTTISSINNVSLVHLFLISYIWAALWSSMFLS